MDKVKIDQPQRHMKTYTLTALELWCMVLGPPIVVLALIGIFK